MTFITIILATILFLKNCTTTITINQNVKPTKTKTK